ncbi:MAG TPA: MFS transporter [Thermomicrobiales bacterium]|nr:MFS transporter [Thermomicrobiales bacterium]
MSRPPQAGPARRRSRRKRGRFTDRHLLVGEGFFSGTATATHNAFFVTLLVQLNVSSLALGIYTSLNGLLANASGLAGGRLRRHIPNRRTLAAVTGGLGRLGFLLIAILLFLQGADVNLTALIVIALVTVSLIGLGLPVLTSVIADSVNQRERGFFFANRLLASGVGATIVAIGVAALLRQLTFPNGFMIAYLIAAVAGLGSVVCLLSLRRVRNEPVTGTRGAAGFGLFGSVSPLMWRYAGSTFILWFGAALIAPVLTPYILNDLNAAPSFIGLMTAVNATTGLLIQRFWGRRVDRFGSYPVIAVTMAAVSSLPVLYALTPTYWLGLGFEVISGVAWAGYALGNLNYAIEIAPAEDRARYTSVGNAAAGIGSFLGPLVAALLLTFLEPRVLLILSGAIRFSAFLSVRFARPPARD